MVKKYKVYKINEIIRNSEKPKRRITYGIKERLFFFWFSILHSHQGCWGYEFNFNTREEAEEYVKELNKLEKEGRK